MFATERYFILQVLFLSYLLHMSHALQCKTCQKNDPACLLGREVELINCVSDDDQCYTWFDRTKNNVGVQRGCISPNMPEYEAIKEMIEYRNSGCVKRVTGLDCFIFCSNDKCN